MVIKINYKNLISFEGIDGCGKSTQIKLLSEKLSNNNINNFIFREPGGSRISEKIRSILLDKNNSISSESETLLFLAARSNLVNELIEPAIKNNDMILCDRYFDSTIAYQCYGKGMDIEIVNIMNKFAIKNIFPSLTIIFDISPEIVQQRLKDKELDRMEMLGLEFQNKVRKGYIEISKNNNICHIIKCENKSINQIHLEVVELYNLYMENVKI